MAKVVLEEFAKELKLMKIVAISFFNWDSLHARVNSHYKTWSNKKKNHKKITTQRKSV